jgi:choline dehydrogenase-like flavoprotein
MSEASRRTLIKSAAAATLMVGSGANAQPATTACAPAKLDGDSDSTYSRDLLGAKICSSWTDVSRWRDQTPSSSTEKNDIDVVVIGSGMFGGYLADKLYRFASRKPLRILVVEEGPFVLATHRQNLGRSLAKAVTDFPALNAGDPNGALPHKDFWLNPWRIHSDATTMGPSRAATGFYGQAFCVGGRSLLWSGWAPRLTDNDLKKWPQKVREHFLNNAKDGYSRVEREIGADKNTSYMGSTAMLSALNRAFKAVIPTGGASKIEHLTKLEQAPLAVVAAAPQPGIFPFDKFSSAAFLTNALAEDLAKSGGSFENRRLFLVPRARVLKLLFDKPNSRITGLEILDPKNGCQTITISQTTKVVLANGTMEATRLALNDLGIGIPDGTGARINNLMGHLRSNISVKIKRDVFEKFNLPHRPAKFTQEVAAYLIRGEDKQRDRRFHFQVVATSVPPGKEAEDNIWSMVPDIELVEGLLENRDPNYVSLIFRGVGEIGGAHGGGKGFVSNLGEKDENDIPRAQICLTISQKDYEFWREMDLAALRLAYAIAEGKDENIEFQGVFANKKIKEIEAQFDALIANHPPALGSSWRDPLGSTHHEGGTLYMGEPNDGSVTNWYGKFHSVQNAFVAGPALFPSIGSANPSLAGLTMARLTARKIIDEINGVDYIASLNELVATHQFSTLNELLSIEDQEELNP